MINKMVMEALLPLNLPVSFQKYSGKAAVYITFHEYLQSGESFEDDNEAFTGHYIQVDLWSKTDYGTIADDIKRIMRESGFRRLDEADLYEPDTGIYHKGIRFFYLEEVE